MRIERIGLSLDSIAEERRRQHRERPDDETRFDDAPDGAPSDHAGLGHAEAGGTESRGPESGHTGSGGPGFDRDDPTARLRVDLPEEHPRPTRQHAIEAFTRFDSTPRHTLSDTDL